MLEYVQKVSRIWYIQIYLFFSRMKARIKHIMQIDCVSDSITL